MVNTLAILALLGIGASAQSTLENMLTQNVAFNIQHTLREIGCKVSLPIAIAIANTHLTSEGLQSNL